jgi:hypothetical protein
MADRRHSGADPTLEKLNSDSILLKKHTSLIAKGSTQLARARDQLVTIQS